MRTCRRDGAAASAFLSHESARLWNVPYESRNVLTQKPAASTDNMSGFPQLVWLAALRERLSNVPYESRNLPTQTPAASTDTLSGFPPLVPLQAFRHRVNADPEMKL